MISTKSSVSQQRWTVPGLKVKKSCLLLMIGSMDKRERYLFSASLPVRRRLVDLLVPGPADQS